MCIGLDLLDDIVLRHKATVESTVSSFMSRAPRRPNMFSGEQYCSFLEAAVRVHRELLDNVFTRDTLYPGVQQRPEFPCLACAEIGASDRSLHSTNFDACFKVCTSGWY